MVQLWHLYMTTGKTIAMTIWTFVSKVMPWFLMCYLVIAFLPRSKRLLISWLQSPSAVILEPKKIKFVTISIVSPSLCMKWWDHISWSLFFECWVLSQLFHFPLTLIKRLFSSSSLSAVRVISSAYLRLLIFLPTTLIPAWDSSSLAFLNRN